MKMKNIIIVGCPCLILHNSSEKAGLDFSEVCGFDVEDTESCHTFLISINTVVNDSNVLQLVEDEYAEYQCMVKEDIPNHIWEKALVEGDKYQMDIIWGYLKERFPNLSDITLAVLTVPHSNASDERVFSVVKKHTTEFRSRLKLSGSLSSIMRIKLAYRIFLNRSRP